MKKLSLIAVMAIAMVGCNGNGSCNTSQTTEKETTAQAQLLNDPALIGGEKDEHGCLPAAGQTWSALLQECIQVFNVGTRLNPVAVKEGEAVISAFIVKSADESKVEVFLPNEKETFILNANEHKSRKEIFIYKNDKYIYDPLTQALSTDGNVIYKAEEPFK